MTPINGLMKIINMRLIKFLNANHEFDEEHQAMIKADVEKAKAVSDVTIAAMHWGTEFTYQISKTQQTGSAVFK